MTDEELIKQLKDFTIRIQWMTSENNAAILSNLIEEVRVKLRSRPALTDEQSNKLACMRIVE